MTQRVDRLMGDLLLGIDIGTQGVKGVLVSRDGGIAARAQLEHESLYPRPGWCEHDMYQNWWRNPVRVIRALLRQEAAAAERVAAVSVSGVFPVFGPTDAEGRPLRGAILYSDNRAQEETDEINEALGLNLTGESLTPKLLWFLRNEPELAREMRMFFDAAHFMVFRLTGRYLIDTITPGLFGAIYDAPAAAWRPEVCERFCIPEGVLPPARPPVCIAGEVHEKAAQETGLAAGTPVLPGIPDLVASSIGAGVVEPGEAIIYYGTAGVMPVLKGRLIDSVRAPFPEKERLPKAGVGMEGPFLTGPRGISGYVFDYPVYCLTTGEAVRWFRRLFGAREEEAERREAGPGVYRRLDMLAEEVPPGSEGLFFLPHLQGQRSPDFDPAARGVFFGISMSHTRGHFYRAVLESFGYEIRRGLEAFYPEGVALSRVVATGGGAASPLWLKAVSGITGFRQEYVPDVDGSIADCHLAGIALGWYADFSELKNQSVEAASVVEPDPGDRSVYDLLYPVYRDLHRSMERHFAEHFDAVGRLRSAPDGR